jgi:hypothetical protein
VVDEAEPKLGVSYSVVLRSIFGIESEFDVNTEGKLPAGRPVAKAWTAVAEYHRHVQASQFDEIAFFRAIANSGVRALLIGRRALIALGLPVMTRDYDYWIPADEAGALNEAPRPSNFCTH